MPLELLNSSVDEADALGDSLVPPVVFGLYGGAVAGAVDRRKLGLFSAAGSFALFFVLVAAAFAGIEQVGLLYAVVALQAVCFALDAPALDAPALDAPALGAQLAR